MASPPIVLLAALGAILYFSCLGLALTRWLRFTWPPAASLAPALGWGVATAVGFAIQTLIGFTQASTAVLALLALVASGVVLARSRGATSALSAPLPAWAYGLAGAVALIPLIALLPKHADGGVILGTVSSDHSKIAMVDEMTRLGLPVGNPFFGMHGARSTLSYYYLWHFGAAQLSILTRISGWEADAAMTGFTAYSSILLMMGVASRLGDPRSPDGTAGRARPRAAMVWVALFSLTGTLGPVLKLVLGPKLVGRLITQNYAGLAGWMVQASWVPQHLASACCVVVAALLLADLMQRRSVGAVLMLGTTVAAAFGCSAWIGGVGFALAALGIGIVGLVYARGAHKLVFLFSAVAAAVVAIVLALPFLHGEFGTLANRHGGPPIGFHPYEVLGDAIPSGVRRALDFPAYWLVLLPIDLPAIYPVGMVALALYVVGGLKRREAAPHVVSLAVLTVSGLCITWLLASTIANNDLGWRAILPGVMVLTPFAAASLARWIGARAYVPAALAFLLFAVSVPDPLVFGDLKGKPTENAPDFAASPALWSAVRRYAGPSDRVANNPLFLDDLTDWPVNPSWAMLSNRASCWSGWETGRAYVDLSKDRIAAIDAQFIKVFDGKGDADDIRQMAQDYGCKVVVVDANDGAWDKDPFANSPYYRLVDEREDEWRIYKATAPLPAPPGAR